MKTLRVTTLSLLTCSLSLLLAGGCTNTVQNPAFERSIPVAEGRRPIGLFGQPVQEPPLEQSAPAGSPQGM